MKSKDKKKEIYNTPETISGACMTGRIPSEKEFKEMEFFFAERKSTVQTKKTKSVSNKISFLKRFPIFPSSLL